MCIFAPKSYDRRRILAAGQEQVRTNKQVERGAHVPGLRAGFRGPMDRVWSAGSAVLTRGRKQGSSKKKKIQCTFGELEIKRSHPYIAHAQHSFAISPLLQSHVLEFANDQPFERGMTLLQTALPRVKVGSSQSQRLMQHFGNLEQTEAILNTPGSSFQPAESSAKEADTSDAVLYVQVDGGHLRTDEGYRETKVGRIFASRHRIKKSTDDEQVRRRMELTASDYLAHLGPHTEFCGRFDALLGNHRKQAPGMQMVAISDGAEWIAGWLAAKYPHAVTILDFYHAVEHLSEFATLAFSDQPARNEWIELRKEELLTGRLEQAMEAIKEETTKLGDTIAKKGEQLLKYYEKNRYRMKYHEYRAKGYCIGSGAIESAISTLVQQRCKLVGQRWTGRVSAVLNIRAVLKSGKRTELRKLICTQMGTANAA